MEHLRSKTFMYFQIEKTIKCKLEFLKKKDPQK
jgi:hypothetical protein